MNEDAEAAPAKVNLYLHVRGQRADGNHTLDSLVVFADIADRVALQPPRTTPRLTIEGPFAPLLKADSSNLVLRAADALAARDPACAAASFRLTKYLPCAAGLGGGSADAAATLRLIGKAYEERILASLAAKIGADVPVCVGSRPARIGGIGEIISPAPALPPLGLLLVHPGIALATGVVFARCTPRAARPTSLPPGWPNAAALATDLSALRNDLEAPAISLCPVIRDVLAAIAAVPGALIARMSGSGATCFGLFPSVPMAARAARRLARPGWWTWGGGLATAHEPIPATATPPRRRQQRAQKRA